MNRAGEYITALGGVSAYKAYRPNPLPPFSEIEMDAEMTSLLSKAHGELGRLDAASQFVPDVGLFLGSYVRKEALLSSQIEGTQATLEDVLDPDVNTSVDLNVDEVVRYAAALQFAVEELKRLPLCNRLLCSTHRVLMQGVRGQEKNPGEFRKSQNWIGASNSNLATARYVPPTVEDMQKGMNDLEKFIHQDEMDVLLKTALVHYQFETIHPFLDGNGRIGRMLIVLMLLESGVLSQPTLYLSLFLKTNRVEYYDRLSEVRVKGNYEQWIKFFLRGVIATCQDGVQTIARLSELVQSDESKLSRQSKTLRSVFGYAKEHPILSIGPTAKELSLSFNSVASAIKKLLEAKILREVTSKSRNRIYEYTEYVNILKSGTEL